MAAASSAAFADEPARLGVAELVRRCEEIVSTYHAGRTTVDTHTDEYLSEHGIVEPEDVCFLQQVMYGCVRYRRLLKIMTSSLFFKHGGETQRSDATLYTVKLCIAAWRHGSSLTHSPAFGQVLGYLALLRLSELGFADFKAIVLSQERHAMTVFLRFLFDADTLRVWLRPEWMKHYEPSFVEDELVGKALTFAPQVQGVVRVLEGQAAAEASKRDEEAAALKALAEGRGGKGECTVPEPFNLTAPKARLVPPPEETIPIGFKPTPSRRRPMSSQSGTARSWSGARIKTASSSEQNTPTQRRPRTHSRTRRPPMGSPRKPPSLLQVQPFRLKTLERPSTFEKVKAELEVATLRPAASLPTTFFQRLSHPSRPLPSCTAFLTASPSLPLYHPCQGGAGRRVRL